jgi:hypothetical protein
MNFHSIKKKSSITKPVSPISRFKRQKQHGTDERGGNRENVKNPEQDLGMLYNVHFYKKKIQKNKYVGM